MPYFSYLYGDVSITAACVHSTMQTETRHLRIRWLRNSPATVGASSSPSSDSRINTRPINHRCGCELPAATCQQRVSTVPPPQVRTGLVRLGNRTSYEHAPSEFLEHGRRRCFVVLGNKVPAETSVRSSVQAAPEWSATSKPGP